MSESKTAPQALTVAEVEKIIISTECVHSDDVWTRRMAAALAETFNRRLASVADSLEDPALRSAAREVLSFREGDLPGKGWLRDNSGSREALAKLAAAISREA